MCVCTSPRALGNTPSIWVLRTWPERDVCSSYLFVNLDGVYCTLYCLDYRALSHRCLIALRLTAELPGGIGRQKYDG